MTDLARIERLADRGTFAELNADNPCGYRTGTAQVFGRPVVLCATRMDPLPDVDLMVSIRRYIEAQEEAARRRCPLVVLLDAPPPLQSGRGQFTREPDRLLSDPTCCLGTLYRNHATLSGDVPQVGVLFGQLNAALSFPIAMCDVSIVVDGAAMRIGPPRLVQTMIGENPDPATLGSAAMHCQVTGTADVLAPDEAEAIAWARSYLAFFPSHREDDLPRRQGADPLPGPAPEIVDALRADAARGFDMKRLLPHLLDEGTWLEMGALLAPEVITALARVDGHPVGLVASNSKQRGGILFPETCRKMVHFVTLCDAFGIPLIFLADVPGFMVGTANEQAGAVREAALLFSVLGNTRVPRLVVVVRKAYTAGLYALAGPGFSPRAFVAVEGATISTFGKPLLDTLAVLDEFDPREQQGFQEMAQECGHPELLVEKGLLDRVIRLEDLRHALTSFVRMETEPQGGEGLEGRRPVMRP